MPAPDPVLFRIIDRTFGIILQPLIDTYWIRWSQDYDILVGGLIWETFIYQEQLSRSTKIHPRHQHNLLNDDSQDLPLVPMDQDDDFGDDDSDFGDEDDQDL